MKYVKLIARPNTWFKEGTEVFDYDSDYEDAKRLTLEEWNKWLESGIICVRGIRVCESVNELTEVGEEYIDGESCGCREFDVTEID